MKKNYKIEVSVSAYESEYPNKSYYWILYSYETDWQNEGAGWAESPQQAWKEAYLFYNRFKDN